VTLALVLAFSVLGGIVSVLLAATVLTVNRTALCQR
jgi:hypothetical protein